MAKMLRPTRRRSWPGRLLRAIAWLAAVVVVAIAVVWWMARPAAPDAFYDPPGQRPSAPGTLLKSEPFTKGVPAGARGWRILYTTTRADNAAAVASAIVVVSERPGPRPIVAWAHGTTGVAPGCAPSVMSAPFANVPAFDKIAGEGWAFVATDYVGLGTAGGHAYLVGDDAARAVLDSVRAARTMPALALDNRVVVWGHSQGGNSALWSGMRVAAYAPDVNLVGVAALAPASDLAALFSSGRASMFGKIVSTYAARAYGAAYRDADVASYLHGGLSRLLAGDIAARCVGGWETLFSVAETMLLPREGIFVRDPAEGAFGARLRENAPNGAIAAPVLIAQGEADDLVLPAIQSRYVAARCAAGQRIEYRRYPGRDHLSLVALDAPLSAELVQWTRERFAGAPPKDTCAR